MNDELRRKVVVRKAIYFGIILALFTLSMFWRGVLALPVGDPERGVKVDEATKQPLPMRWVDQVARLPIRYQADDLELRELDLGDPEIAGTAAQVSLVGFRGAVVTILWRLAIQNQVRGEYDKLEFYSRLVSRLQPHFIEPWIFQAWNISYNVSVEADRLGDQYYYIAKGISFLSEGDRINTRTYRRGGQQFRIGSPDIRYQLAFYYQNKFTVSDKVETLRSLAQLSNIPPADRDPAKLTVDGTLKGRVDSAKFLKFCETNPELVRRLKKATLNPITNKIEGMNLKTPRDVLDFLAVNQEVPSRYLPTGEPAPEETQFPVFPKSDDPALAEFVRKVLGRSSWDTIDPLHAARAWFEYAQEVVPPSIKPGQTRGEPSAVPKKGEYDEFRYRIPQRPSLVVFRMAPCRSQNYLAEQLQKEGWIDAASVWEPDAATDDKWFPARAAGRDPVRLKAGLNSADEWREAHALWERFGRLNGMDPIDRQAQEDLARPTEAKLGPIGQMAPREYTDEELAAMGITPEMMRARQAVLIYEQNRNITNYQYFLDASLLETDPRASRARQLLWDARQMHEAGNETQEANVRVEAGALWRAAVGDTKHRGFYQNDRADPLHEFTLQQELDLAKLLEGTPEVAKRVAAVRTAVGAVGPSAVAAAAPHLARVLAEDEAQARIAAAYPSDDVTKRVKELMAAAEKLPGVKPDESVTRRGLMDTEFAWMKEYVDPARTMSWVRPSVRMKYLTDRKILLPPPAPETPEGAGQPEPAGAAAPDRRPAPPPR